MRSLKRWHFVGVIIIGLITAVMLWSRISSASEQFILRSVGNIMGVSAHLDHWHIDPLRHAAIIYKIRLRDDLGTALSAESLEVHYEGQSDEHWWAPRYRVELVKPSIRMTQGADGRYRLGKIVLPPENSPQHSFPLPRKVSFTGGNVRVIHELDAGKVLVELDAIKGHFERGPRKGELNLDLRWQHPSDGSYGLQVHRDDATSPLELALNLEDAQLAAWKDLYPSTLPWQPLSGVFTGHIKMAFEPGMTKPTRLALEHFKATEVRLRHQTEISTEFTMALLSGRHLSAEPARHHYRAEAIEILDLSSPKAHLKRLIAPAYDSEYTAKVHDIDPIQITGLSYVETQVAELILEGLHPRGEDDLFRLDNLIIHGISGPRMNAPMIHIDDVVFDPHERTVTAALGHGKELSGAFGTLTDIKALNIRLTLSDDCIALEQLTFGESHTKTFTTLGGRAEGIEWDRLNHDISVKHTHLDHSRMAAVTMEQLDAEEAHFETLTKRLHMKRLTGRQGEVKEDGHPAIAVHELNLYGYHSDALRTHWGANQVHVEGAKMDWIVHPDNHFELKGLTLGLGKQGTSGASSAPKKHWTYEIEAISLTHSEAHLTDLGTTPPTQVNFKDLNVSADDLDSRAHDDTDIIANARIGSRGSVAISGRMARSPLSAVFRIDLQRFRLPILAPYWNAVSRLALKRGYANFTGELRIIPGEHHHFEFEGDGHIDELETRDPISGRNIISVKKLTLDDVAISSDPKRFFTRVMDFEEAYLHLVLKADHHLNLAELFRIEDPAIVPTEIKAMHFDPSPYHEPPHAAIGLVRFHGSRVDYSDLGFKPQLSTSVRELSGTLRGLTSRHDGKAEVSLSGKINRNSPVRLSGDLEPMDYQDHTDLLLDFTGLNMTSFPQYAGRFSGYRVNRGKLNLDLHYQIHQSTIEVENRAVIDRLTLGEKIEDAHHLLVDLALWMLKDNRGNLDIDLPIYGDLENPSYELGTLYAEALVQFFGKVFTTPATLVQDLIPTTHEEKSIPFEPGQREVNPKFMSNLARVIDVFKDQDGGVIEITPSANPKTDGMALADDALKLELKEAYVHDMRLAGKPVISREDLQLSEQDIRRQFTRYFMEHHPDKQEMMPLEEKEDRTDSPAFDRAWQHALEEWRTSPDLLLDLAEDRAESIRDRLVHDYDIDDGSIYLRQAEFQSDKSPVPIRVEYFSD